MYTYITAPFKLNPLELCPFPSPQQSLQEHLNGKAPHDQSHNPFPIGINIHK